MCGSLIQPAYGVSVVLLRCSLVPKKLQGMRSPYTSKTGNWQYDLNSVSVTYNPTKQKYKIKELDQLKYMYLTKKGLIKNSLSLCFSL
jgi:hypothetical protein